MVVSKWFKRRLTVCVLALFATLGGAVASAAVDPKVFESLPADHAPVLSASPAPAGSPLRVLTVEERMGVARERDLVRVPLFFHAGECRDPDALTIYAEGDAGKQPIVYQADDIRRAADGSVARMHVYFAADLKPWERKRFHLVPGKAASAAPVAMTSSGEDVTFKGQDLQVTFRAEGPQAGGITLLKTAFAQVAAVDAPLGPNVKLIRQSGEKGLKKLRENPITYADPSSFEVRQIQYATGPLFAKLRVRIGPKDVPDALESTYLIPQHGTALIATHRMMPEEQATADTVTAIWPAWLQGRAKFGKDKSVPRQVKIGAGVRRLTRHVHGFNLEAAASDESGFSFLNVPEVVWGNHGVYAKEDGELVFMGPGTMKRNGDSNSGTLRAWWFGLRYVLAPTTDEEKLYDIGLSHMQPLVAIVDEPAITVDDLQTQMNTLAGQFFAIKYWGRAWQQDAAMYYLQGKEEQWRKPVKARADEPKKAGKYDETEWRAYVPKWAREQIDAGGTIPLNRPKGSDKDVAQMVEPYPVGYSMSSMVTLAKMEPSERMDKITHAVAKASMWTSGGVYKNGWPRINAFSNAYNMQIGSVMFGLYAGGQFNDVQMQQFYRDVTRSPGAVAIYGRGLRCYSGDVRKTEQSDALYQAISDLWLRCTELNANENLMLHPTVFGRYSDAVDVTADLQHRPPDEAPGAAIDVHANFFRTQAHDHRWEGWDALPFIQMLRDPTDAKPAGLTDAVYFTHQRAQGKVNWSELMCYFHPLAMLQHVRGGYSPPALPPLPADVQAKPGSEGMTVSWSPVKGAAGYRVYRASRQGEPLTFVNTPYGPAPQPLASGTSFSDPEGKPGDFYFVTAVDAQGRESHWFPNEPSLVAGAKAKSTTGR